MTDDDVPMVLRWRNVPAVRAAMYTRHVISEAEHHAWWKAQKGRDDRSYHIHMDEGKPTGYVAFTDIQPTHRRASWAFYAADDAPKGTGRKMETSAIRHAFGPLGLDRLVCEVLDFNTKVIALHETFGFLQEGRWRHHMHIDGTWHDVVLLGLLKGEERI
jgi:UDP-4-amino-4,6-dideoxy-N-acetyl-beta-L-altrosamine N-acetyltransferase